MIENIGSSGPVRPERASGVPDERDRPGRAVQQVSRVPPRDRVEISERGRVLAARQELVAWLQAQTGKSPEAIAELLARLEEGAYDSPTIAREVARRLLESGDL
jgi:hypothetical protein|nr:MAG: hypothetical protein DIU52_11985 [bacterium]